MCVSSCSCFGCSVRPHRNELTESGQRRLLPCFFCPLTLEVYLELAEYVPLCGSVRRILGLLLLSWTRPPGCHLSGRCCSQFALSSWGNSLIPLVCWGLLSGMDVGECQMHFFVPMEMIMFFLILVCKYSELYFCANVILHSWRNPNCL